MDLGYLHELEVLLERLLLCEGMPVVSVPEPNGLRPRSCSPTPESRCAMRFCSFLRSLADRDWWPEAAVAVVAATAEDEEG